MGCIVRSVTLMCMNLVPYFFCYELCAFVKSKVIQEIIAMSKLLRSPEGSCVKDLAVSQCDLGE